ncbi:MAG: OmpA family protein [Pseudoruegeria sp.]
MRLKPTLIAGASFAIAAVLCVVAAGSTVAVIEERTQNDVKRALSLQGFDWVETSIDGLVVNVTGVAPTEATRFRALSVVGTVVDHTRINSDLEVVEADLVPAPDFSIEFLRNDDGITLVGLIPASGNRRQILSAVSTAGGGAVVTDLLDTADYPMPDGWPQTVDFAIDALRELPRSKISMSAEKIQIAAMTDSTSAQQKLLKELALAAPNHIDLSLDLSAPRPVLTPFTLRFIMDEEGARFDDCSVDTEEGRLRIRYAGASLGAPTAAACTIGLGVPSVNWTDAVETALGAVGKLGGGTLTFRDADVSLIAPESTKQADFDKIMGELEADLPEVFSLSAELPLVEQELSAEAVAALPEFNASLSEEGLVQIWGKLGTDLDRDASESYARALFGNANVYATTRLGEGLPRGWPVRVLSGLSALAELNNGTLSVTEDRIEIAGVTGNPDARSDIARIFTTKLDGSGTFSIKVVYEEKFDPVAALPTADECVADLNMALAENKITFEPGSGDINAGSLSTIDKLADTLKTCADVPMQLEIAGYTDSQGRETMNLSLSQSRADAVLSGLMARRVLTGNITAQGYGEENPIADNDTADGREANRRIEITIVVPEAEENAEEAPLPADPSTEDAAPDAADTTTSDGEPIADTTDATGEASNE